MHHILWAGIDLKLGHAQFFLDEMSRSLQRPPRTEALAAAISADVNGDTRWQLSFYANLDAFLVMTRSIPAIIEYCFGKDPQTKKVAFESLDGDEQNRRLKFSEEFDKPHGEFRQHPLSKQRNISFHRTGYPDVEVKIAGHFGIDYIGNPIKAVPTGENRPSENIGDDPAKMFAATLPPLPIQPRFSDFTIDGKPLFEECKSYLDRASELVARARKISQRVHGYKPLTTLLT
jgi:hypothetical protein